MIRVAHLGSLDVNNPSDMRYYLQRVVDGSDAMPIELVDLRQSDGVILPVESDLRLLIASEAIPEGLIPSVKTLLAKGGTLFAIPRTAAEADSLRTLLPEAWSFREAEVADYAMLGNIDFTHPLFSAFSDIKFFGLFHDSLQEISCCRPSEICRERAYPCEVLIRGNSVDPGGHGGRGTNCHPVVGLAAGRQPAGLVNSIPTIGISIRATGIPESLRATAVYCGRFHSVPRA